MTVAAAAASLGCDVYVPWHDNESGSDNEFGSNHAKMNLAQVESYVIWPKNFHLLTKKEFDVKTANFSNIQYDVDGVEKSFWALDSAYTTAWKNFQNAGPVSSSARS